MVELQPSKLIVWVRFPSPAPDIRSIIRMRFIENVAHIAQSAEHFLGKEEVTGSNPVMSSSEGLRAMRIPRNFNSVNFAIESLYNVKRTI